MKIRRFGRQFAKHCFIAVFLCLFTLGPASNVRASSGFHVSGRFLLDANGNNFIMRGINVPHNWYPDETSSSLQNIKAKGANTVRIVLSDGQSVEDNWPKNTASDVANVINLCKANKLICILEVHDTTNNASTLAQAVAYWTEIKSALMGQEPYVIINIGNEPYGNPPPDGPKDTSLWTSDTKNAIAQLRAAGFQHTLMVDAPDWGQDWEGIMKANAASVFNSDPIRNTVFSIHMYEVFDTPGSVQNYAASFVNAGLPLVIGEFGPVNGGVPAADVDAVMATAQANGIGYLGWEWSGGGELDMVSNFNPAQETSWGNRIIHGPNGIASTSQQASVYGTANLDGVTTGVFRPSNGALYLKNTNTTGFADIQINYGQGGDYPITGDWNGDGIDTIGVYRNGYFYLRNSNSIGFADLTFPFGSAGDQPIAGDWDGDGKDTIGVYHSSTSTFYLRNSNSAGAPDAIFSLGIPGDIGIAGDWDGDGKDTTGVFRPSNGVIFLKNSNQTGYADIAINYGIGGDKPVTGDWNNDGIDTIGILRGNTFYLRNSNTVGYADISFALGNPGDMPIAGNWDGLP